MNAASAVTGVLRQINSACHAADGTRLAQLLSLRDAHVQTVHAAVPAVNVESLARSNVRAEPAVAAIAAAHLRCAAKLMAGDFEAAFELQCKCCSEMANYVRDIEEGNWQLKPLNMIMYELRQLAKLVEDLTSGQENKVEAISKATRVFQDCFRAVGNDRGRGAAGSKKLGMMFIANHVLNLAFRDNNFAFVNTIMRTMKSNKDIERFQPMSHRVTFYYFMGRKSLLDAAYESVMHNTAQEWFFFWGGGRGGNWFGLLHAHVTLANKFYFDLTIVTLIFLCFFV